MAQAIIVSKIESYRQIFQFENKDEFDFGLFAASYLSSILALCSIKEWKSHASALSSFDLIAPSNLTAMVEDLISGNAKLTLSLFYSIYKSLRNKENLNIDSTVSRIDDLQLVFGLAKKIYNKNTLNYAIYNGVQEKLIDLENSLKLKNITKAELISNEIFKIIQALVSSKKRLKDAGIDMPTLQDTGKKIGDLKIFKVK